MKFNGKKMRKLCAILWILMVINPIMVVSQKSEGTNGFIFTVMVYLLPIVCSINFDITVNPF